MGTRGRHLANVCPADEQDVRPHDIRPNRNAARENETNDRTLHSNLADRTKSFFPDAVGDDDDDPRTCFLAEVSRRSAVSHAAAHASDAIVPAESHALSRCSDTGVVLSTTATDAPPPGTFRCNRGSEHRPAENDNHIPSAGSFATRSDRRGLVRSNVLKHPEEGPRELLSRKVKSRIEAPNFNPRRLFFDAGISAVHHQTLHRTCANTVNASGPAHRHPPPAI